MLVSAHFPSMPAVIVSNGLAVRPPLLYVSCVMIRGVNLPA